MDQCYSSRCDVFIFDDKNDFEIWSWMMKKKISNYWNLGFCLKGVHETYRRYELLSSLRVREE